MVLINTKARTPDRIIQFKTTSPTTTPAKAGVGYGGGFSPTYKPVINTPSIAKIVNNNAQLSENINKQVQDLIAKQKIDVPKITLDVVTKIQFSKTTTDIIRNAINGVGAIDTAVNKVKSNMPTGILQNASTKDLQNIQYIVQPVKTPTQMVQDAISGIKAVKEITLRGLDQIKFADNGLMQMATYEKDKIFNITNQQIKINLLKNQGLTTKELLDKMETTNIEFTIAEPGKQTTQFTDIKNALDYYNTRKTATIKPMIQSPQYITIEKQQVYAQPPKEYPIRITIEKDGGNTQEQLAFKTKEEALKFTETERNDKTNYGVRITDWTSTIKDKEASPKLIESSSPIWAGHNAPTQSQPTNAAEEYASRYNIEGKIAANLSETPSMEGTTTLKTSQFLTVANPKTTTLISTIKATQPTTTDKDTFTGVTSVEKKNEKWNIPILGETGNEGLQWIQKNIYDGAQKELVANGWLRQDEITIKTGTQTPNIIKQTLGITPETQVEVLTITKTTKEGNIVNQQTLKDKQNGVIVSPQKNDLLYMNIGENGTIKPDVIKTFAPSILIRDIDDWNGKIVANALGEQGINDLYNNKDVIKNMATYRKGLTTEKANAIAQELLSFNLGTGNPLVDGVVMLASGGILGFETKLVEKVGMKGLAEASKIAQAVKATGIEFKAANIALPITGEFNLADTLVNAALTGNKATNIAFIANPGTIAKQVFKKRDVPTLSTDMTKLNKALDLGTTQEEASKFVKILGAADDKVAQAYMVEHITLNPSQFYTTLSRGSLDANLPEVTKIWKNIDIANIKAEELSKKLVNNVVTMSKGDDAIAAKILEDTSAQLGTGGRDVVESMVNLATLKGTKDYNEITRAMTEWEKIKNQPIIQTTPPTGVFKAVTSQETDLTSIMEPEIAEKIQSTWQIPIKQPSIAPTGGKEVTYKIKIPTTLTELIATTDKELQEMAKILKIDNTELKTMRDSANAFRIKEETRILGKSYYDTRSIKEGTQKALDRYGNNDLSMIMPQEQKELFTKGATKVVDVPITKTEITSEAVRKINTIEDVAKLSDEEIIAISEKTGIDADELYGYRRAADKILTPVSDYVTDAKRIQTIERNLPSDQIYDISVPGNLRNQRTDTTVEMIIGKYYDETTGYAQPHSEQFLNDMRKFGLEEKTKIIDGEEVQAWTWNKKTTNALTDKSFDIITRTNKIEIESILKNLDPDDILTAKLSDTRKAKMMSLYGDAMRRKAYTRKTVPEFLDTERITELNRQLETETSKMAAMVDEYVEMVQIDPHGIKSTFSETLTKAQLDMNTQRDKVHGIQNLLEIEAKGMKTAPGRIVAIIPTKPGNAKPTAAAKSAIDELKKGNFETAAKKLGESNNYANLKLFEGKNADIYRDISVAKIKRMKEFGAPSGLMDRMIFERADYALHRISEMSNDMKRIALKINNGNVDKLTDLEAQKLWDEAKDLGLDATESAGKPNQLIKRLSDDAIKSNDPKRMQKLAEEMKEQKTICINKGDCKGVN